MEIGVVLDRILNSLQSETKIDKVMAGDGVTQVPVLSVPKDRDIKGVDDLIRAFEKTCEVPYRRRGQYIAADVASFLSWMKANTEAGAPVFLAGLESLAGKWRQPDIALIGIGNYSDRFAAGWHDFRARHAFPVSEQWTVWCGAHEKAMSQTDFAEFIENRVYDLATPARGEVISEAVTRFLETIEGKSVATPSDLVRLSRGLKISADAKLESKINLGSGEVTLKYTEDHKGPGGEPIKVPQAFYIRIPVFFGREPSLLGVRLRYRMAGGNVSWSFSLIAPDQIVADEIAAVGVSIRSEGRTLYLGSPDMP